jgi:hypothetical protein
MEPSEYAQHETDSDVRPSDDFGTEHIDPTGYFALEFHLETLASHVWPLPVSRSTLLEYEGPTTAVVVVCKGRRDILPLYLY